MADSSFFAPSTTRLGSARERARRLDWDVDATARPNWRGATEGHRRRWWNDTLARSVRRGRMEEDPRVARPFELVKSRYLGTLVRRSRPPAGVQLSLDDDRKGA